MHHLSWTFFMFFSCVNFSTKWSNLFCWILEIVFPIFVLVLLVRLFLDWITLIIRHAHWTIMVALLSVIFHIATLWSILFCFLSLINEKVNCVIDVLINKINIDFWLFEVWTITFLCFLCSRLNVKSWLTWFSVIAQYWIMKSIYIFLFRAIFRWIKAIVIL